MTALVSFAALFLSVFFVQLGSGSLGPLDALAASARGYTTAEIGLLGSAHFLGFFFGCWLAPRYIGAVGHARAFAAAAAVGAAGALLHPVLEGPLWWAGLRLLTGLAIASAYTVVESWLQAKTPNAMRGRIFSVYRLVDMGSQIVAQGMIAVLDPTGYAAYNIVAVFCCLCLLPLTLTRSVPPAAPRAPRLRPLVAFRLSPTACIGIVVAGMTGSAFRMVGPLYAVESGLGAHEIAVFLSAAIIGGMAAQYPVGWIADKIDRRRVLVGCSALAIVCSLGLTVWMDPGVPATLYLGALVFGMTSYPIYSISAAYANDLAPEDFMVELNAAIIFYFSLGAIVSPYLAAQLIALHGPAALFALVAAAHLALVAFSLYRMTRRPAVEPSEPYRYMPRTSMVLSRLIRRDRGGPSAAPGGAPGRQTEDEEGPRP